MTQDRENLRAIYAKIPVLKCAGKCQECCGPILVTPLERKQMRRHAPPQNPPPKRDALTCPSLDVAFGKCAVYADRPTICRLWGVVEGRPCPWGCEPEHVLSDAEGRAILAEVAALSHGIEVL